MKRIERSLSDLTNEQVLIAYCLKGLDEAKKLVFTAGIRRDWFLKKDDRAMFDAIIKALALRTINLTVDEVWYHSDRSMTLEQIESYYFDSYITDSHAFFCAENLKSDLGYSAAYKAVERALSRLQDKRANVEEVKIELQQALSRVRSVDMLPADAKNILDRHKQELTQEISEPIRIHLRWFLDVTNGGLRSKRLYGIAGPDKSRKSTLLRNIFFWSMYRPAKNELGIEINKDLNLAYLARENDQQTTVFDFMSMLMVWKIYQAEGKRGLDKVERGKRIEEYCNSEILLTNAYTDRFLKVPGIIQESLEWAEEVINQSPLTVYDSMIESGGFVTVDDMWRIMNENVALHGKKNNLIAVDYNGLVETPQMTGYEGQTAVVAKELLAANTLPNTAVIALAQYSRSYQKEMGKDSTRTVGTDNSPALERSVHNYWQVEYTEENPSNLTVRQVRARRSAGGTKSAPAEFLISPVSGLILSSLERG